MMKTLFGRTDTQEILELPTIEGLVDETAARSAQSFPEGPLPLVPVLLTPRPPDEPTKRWELRYDWTGEAPLQVWDELTVPAEFPTQFLVEPEGIVLAMGERDRTQFAQMLALIREALDLGMITDSTVQKIADVNDQLHEVTTLRFRQIMVAYGSFYKSHWDATKTPA
ncbi:MAG: hypothetical protein V4672_13010 [Verrucomicrobiota bacterium]